MQRKCLWVIIAFLLWFQPALAVQEVAVFELVGINEQGDASEYSASATFQLDWKGTITKVCIVTSESGTGAIRTPSMDLMFMDADPATTAGDTAFSYDFNYGYAKYEDFGNRNFTVTDFEAVGLANANDGSFEIELLHHNDTGWTYDAAAFQAGNTPLLSMNTIHGTEQDIDAGAPFAFKRTGLGTTVDGNALEGVIVRVTTGANDAVTYMDSHIGIRYN